MKAFPLKAVNKFDDQEGMELRDYFAAKAMQAMIQNSASLKDTDYSFDNAVHCGVDTTIDLSDSERDLKYTWAQYYAEEAYCIADAMIKARGE